MDISALLTELYDRVPQIVTKALDGLGLDEVTEAPAPGANSIAWLVWHLTRVQDHHVSELMGEEQVWVGGTWASEFGLEADPTNTGFGHNAEQTLSVRPNRPEVLSEYLAAVYAHSNKLISTLGPDDLERIVDRRWDPPVTLGVRLVSVACDNVQHAGQAAYVRGLLERAR